VNRSSGDVIDLLDADLDLVLAELQREDTPFWRRTCARLFISYVESLVFQLKRRALAAAGADLAPAEKAMLADQRYEVTNTGRARTTTYHPKLRSNFKFAFAQAARACGVELAVDYDDEGWQQFKRSIEIRNRLAHPRDREALQVGDEELQSLLAAVDWVRRQYAGFLAAVGD